MQTRGELIVPRRVASGSIVARASGSCVFATARACARLKLTGVPPGPLSPRGAMHTLLASLRWRSTKLPADYVPATIGSHRKTDRKTPPMQPQLPLRFSLINHHEPCDFHRSVEPGVHPRLRAPCESKWPSGKVFEGSECPAAAHLAASRHYQHSLM